MDATPLILGAAVQPAVAVTCDLVGRVSEVTERKVTPSFLRRGVFGPAKCSKGMFLPRIA